MNKKRAKQELKNIIEDFNNSSINKNAWQFQAASLIEKIFGRKSVEYSFISQYKEGISYRPLIDPEPTIDDLKRNKQKMIDFLNGCIKAVNWKGIIKGKKSNIFESMNNWKILLILISILVAGILIGNYLPDSLIIIILRVFGK